MADSDGTKTATPMPTRFAVDVRALADDISNLTCAYNQLDMMPSERIGRVLRNKFDAAEDEIMARRRLLESLAHMGASEDAASAVLQLGVMVDIFDDMYGCLANDQNCGFSELKTTDLRRRFHGLAARLLHYLTRDDQSLRDGPLARTFFVGKVGRDPIVAAQEALGQVEAA